MSTRNLSGADRPSRSSSVRLRIRSISARSLTRWLSCQRQSFHCSSGTSAQQRGAAADGGPAVGAERARRIAPVDERRLGQPREPHPGARRRTLISWASTRAVGRPADRGKGVRRIKSMQSACPGDHSPAAVRAGSVAPDPCGESATADARVDAADALVSRGPGSATRRRTPPITAQRKPIMMKKPLNRAIRPMPP